MRRLRQCAEDRIARVQPAETQARRPARRRPRRASPECRPLGRKSTRLRYPRRWRGRDTPDRFFRRATRRVPTPRPRVPPRRAGRPVQLGPSAGATAWDRYGRARWPTSWWCRGTRPGTCGPCTACWPSTRKGAERPGEKPDERECPAAPGDHRLRADPARAPGRPAPAEGARGGAVHHHRPLRPAPGGRRLLPAPRGGPPTPAPRPGGERPPLRAPRLRLGPPARPPPGPVHGLHRPDRGRRGGRLPGHHLPGDAPRHRGEGPPPGAPRADGEAPGGDRARRPADGRRRRAGWGRAGHGGERPLPPRGPRRPLGGAVRAAGHAPDGAGGRDRGRGVVAQLRHR